MAQAISSLFTTGSVTTKPMDEESSAGSPWRRLLVATRQLLCGLDGHQYVKRFEPDRLSLACCWCGRQTEGWHIGETRPRPSTDPIRSQAAAQSDASRGPKPAPNGPDRSEGKRPRPHAA